jgi:hypothetical protein
MIGVWFEPCYSIKYTIIYYIGQLEVGNSIIPKYLYIYTGLILIRLVINDKYVKDYVFDYSYTYNILTETFLDSDENIIIYTLFVSIDI